MTQPWEPTKRNDVQIRISPSLFLQWPTLSGSYFVTSFYYAFPILTRTIHPKANLRHWLNSSSVLVHAEDVVKRFEFRAPFRKIVYNSDLHTKYFAPYSFDFCRIAMIDFSILSVHGNHAICCESEWILSAERPWKAQFADPILNELSVPEMTGFDPYSRSKISLQSS